MNEPSRLPARAGIGAKPQHDAEILGAGDALGFLEVHAENYMVAGGPMLRQLERWRAAYPLSLHGVALSIGGETPLDRDHLDALKRLVDRFEPRSFSEHLAWSTHDGAYLNDLLPVSYDGATLERVTDHIDRVQTHLRRRILLENPSTYLAFTRSTYAEVDFIAEVARRTGCGLLLDVNNVQVSCVNHGLDPVAYLDAFPIAQVGQIHLAGYAEDRDAVGDRLLIDAHDRPVRDDVWALYRHALKRHGPVATLIEWDNDLPGFATLLAEARKAEAAMAEIAPGARQAA